MTDRPSELAGIPLQAHGWTLDDVALRGDQLIVRYASHDGSGSIAFAVVSPSAALDVAQRLEHCAVFHETELATGSLEHRARALELLGELAQSVDRALDRSRQSGGPGFPDGLAWRPDLPRRIELGPQGVLALLPEVAERELASGFRLLDAYFGPGPDSSVCLELGREHDPNRVVLEVSISRQPRAGSHFEISSSALGSGVFDDDGEAHRASAALVALLLALRDSKELVITKPSSQALAASEPEGEDALPLASSSSEAAFRREAVLLAPAIDAGQRHFARRVTLRCIADAGSEAYAITFPSALPLTPRAFGIRRALRTYLEALGFADFVDDGVLSVPTPESFSRLLTQRGHASAGMRPWLDASSSWDEPVSERLELYTEGRIGIRVPSFAFLDQHRALLRVGRPRRTWLLLLEALGSDMTERVLPLHRVPHAAVLTIGARVSEVLRELKRQGRDDALGPLLDFYERDLIEHCQEIWARLGRPDDFAEVFELPALRRRLDAALDRRIDRALAAASERKPLITSERARSLVHSAAGALSAALSGARRWRR